MLNARTAILSAIVTALLVVVTSAQANMATRGLEAQEAVYSCQGYQLTVTQDGRVSLVNPSSPSEGQLSIAGHSNGTSQTTLYRGTIATLGSGLIVDVVVKIENRLLEGGLSGEITIAQEIDQTSASPYFCKK